jgi:hypothetical protein
MTAAPPPYREPWPAAYGEPLPPPRSGGRKRIWLLVGMAVLIVIGVAAGGAFLLVDDRTPRETAEAFVNSYADGDCQAGWDLMSISARDKLGDPQAVAAPTSFCDRWKLDPGESFRIVDLVTMTQAGNKATVKITTSSTANGKETETLHLVNTGGEWKVDG